MNLARDSMRTGRRRDANELAAQTGGWSRLRSELSALAEALDECQAKLADQGVGHPKTPYSEPER